MVGARAVMTMVQLMSLNHWKRDHHHHRRLCHRRNGFSNENFALPDPLKRWFGWTRRINWLFRLEVKVNFVFSMPRLYRNAVLVSTWTPMLTLQHISPFCIYQPHTIAITSWHQQVISSSYPQSDAFMSLPFSRFLIIIVRSPSLRSKPINIVWRKVCLSTASVVWRHCRWVQLSQDRILAQWCFGVLHISRQHCRHMGFAFPPSCVASPTKPTSGGELKPPWSFHSLITIIWCINLMICDSLFSVIWVSMPGRTSLSHVLMIGVFVSILSTAVLAYRSRKICTNNFKINNYDILWTSFHHIQFLQKPVVPVKVNTSIREYNKCVTTMPQQHGNDRVWMPSIDSHHNYFIVCLVLREVFLVIHCSLIIILVQRVIIIELKWSRVPVHYVIICCLIIIKEGDTADSFMLVLRLHVFIVCCCVIEQ